MSVLNHGHCGHLPRREIEALDFGQRTDPEELRSRCDAIFEGFFRSSIGDYDDSDSHCCRAGSGRS